MDIKNNEDKEYISVIAVRIKEPETNYDWDCWVKYIKSQMSIADKCTDRDMESAAARLMNLGFKVLDTRVICCLSETSYDRSILDKLKDNESFIESYVN